MRDYTLEICNSCGHKTFYRFKQSGKGFCKMCYRNGKSARGSKEVRPNE